MATSVLPVLLVTLTCLSSWCQASECNPPIPGCECYENTLLQCRELSSFPVAPMGYNEFMFEACTFSVIDDIPYSEAISLFIQNSGVTRIEDGVFSGMGKLKQLSLTSNLLSNVTKATLQGLSDLQQLDLTNNRLTRIPSNLLSSVPNLEYLTLDYNTKLVFPSDDFFEGSKVNNLSLNAVGLKEVPTSVLSKATELGTLSLHKNNLGAVKDNSFRGLSNLIWLSFDSCNITTIEDGAFNGLSKLVYLNLGYNRLTTISENSIKPFWGSLRTILLENNRLTTISEDTLPWNQLEHIRLGYNPWHCDCELKWMKTLDLKHRDPENVTCETPEEYAGKSIKNVTEDMLCTCLTCANKSTVALAIVIPILTICLLLICYFLYRIIQNRRERERQRQNYMYSSVYKDTVKSAPPPRPTSSPQRAELA